MGCLDYDFNPDKTWATLKRGPSDEEMDIFEWEGMAYTMEDVEGKFGNLESGDGKSRSTVGDILEQVRASEASRGGLGGLNGLL
jgi:hypothetical protein